VAPVAVPAATPAENARTQQLIAQQHIFQQQFAQQQIKKQKRASWCNYGALERRGLCVLPILYRACSHVMCHKTAKLPLPFEGALPTIF
jgi:hypothetical protein